MALDPVGLALTQSRLDYISRRMGWVMMRTARSPIFSHSHDFSCFVTDGAGEIVSQADGIPIHTGGGGFAVRALLKSFGNSLSEGDVVLLNDPYVAGGNHLPDWLVARPVFVNDHRVAFACNRAHQSDIGGGSAGTYNAAATEIYHEGVRLPPLKLVERGEPRADLWQFLLLNTRTPQLLDGDLRAMLGATRIGAEMVAEMVADIGFDDALRHLAGILDHADRMFRGCLSELPDGVYRADERLLDDQRGGRAVTIRLSLSVLGDTLHADFDGTDGQVPGFKNSSLANTHSAVYTGLSTFFDPGIPRNAGTFRSVTIAAPEGTLVNPRPPAPVGMCTSVPAHQIIQACWQALSQALPERSCAPWGLRMVPVMSGLNRLGQPYVMYHMGAHSGGGAVNGRDGFDQIGPLETLGGQIIPDAEAYEQLYPVRVIRQEFRHDACGHGQYRGGTGVDYEAEVELPATYYFRSEGALTPKADGNDTIGRGASGALDLLAGPGDPVVPGPYDTLAMPPGRIRIRSSAGSGWGDPLHREPTRVLGDVRDGVLSAVLASQVYGVVLDAACRQVNADATARRRQAMRRERAVAT